jgi:hypothetical protein
MMPRVLRAQPTITLPTAHQQENTVPVPPPLFARDVAVHTNAIYNATVVGNATSVPFQHLQASR